MKKEISLAKFQRNRRLVLFILVIVIFMATIVVGASGSELRRSYIEAFGLWFIVAGILGRLWCMLYIGKRKGVELIETGPYSITRNPLYVFSALAALGAGAQSGSIVLAVIFAIGTVAVFYFVALREEAFLKDRFGAPFNAYCLRVPRFWPSFRLYRDEPTVFASTDRLYTTLKDGLIFFLAKPAFDFIEYLQLWGFMPILVRLI